MKELENYKGVDEVFAELEKHLTENFIDDVREFVNEGEHATVKKFKRAISRHASTLSDVESEIEIARSESATIREAHANASKALTLAEEEVARKKKVRSYGEERKARGWGARGVVTRERGANSKVTKRHNTPATRFTRR